LRIRALRLTPVARAWLQAAGPARPLHIFSQVCNLIDDGGRVLSLQTARLADGPLSLTVPAQVGGGQGLGHWIHDQTSIVRLEDRLTVGKLTIEWAGAENWDPTPDWQRLRADQGFTSRLPALRRLLAAGAPPGGLAGLLDEGEVAADSLAAQLLATAGPLAAALQSALRSGNRSRLQPAAAGLAGLGGGLTPSGDDYLVGVMHALWIQRPPAESTELSELLVSAAVPRTTPLSAAWLQAAADGQASRLWHDLLEALLSAEGGAIEAPARALMAVGHTSGADALAGFLQAFE
jgi:hypothetical protein